MFAIMTKIIMTGSNSKTFVAGVDDLVVRALRGYVRCNSSLSLDPETKIVYKKNIKELNKVLLLSGGGSGHEPAHVGFIGKGMLDVAVCGHIFASPSTSQILSSLLAHTTDKGALLIIKNYTGDVLNFGLAAKKAELAGHRVKIVVVGDDVSIGKKATEKVGRRGLAGVSMVHKIAGAAAADGLELDEVFKVAEEASANLVTIGVSLDHCHVPGRDATEDRIVAGEMEYGMGIHNEPGVQKAKIPTLEETILYLLNKLVGKGDDHFVHLQKGDNVALMVNNLGGISSLEMSIICDQVAQSLSTDFGLSVKMILTGSFVSSLNAPGFSITLLRLSGKMEFYLASTTDAPGWPISKSNFEPSIIPIPALKATTNLAKYDVNSQLFSICLREIHNEVTLAEPLITKYDTIAGDGDCGETLMAGTSALMWSLENNEIPTTDLIDGIAAISNIVEQAMGGTSGAIYSIFLTSLARVLDELVKANTYHSTVALLSTACKLSLDELCQYTKARVGDRTMMDALIPFIEAFSGTISGFKEAVIEGAAGAKRTAKMVPAFGRATYVNTEIWVQSGGIPDPGALGIVSVLNGITKGLGLLDAA